MFSRRSVIVTLRNSLIHIFSYKERIVNSVLIRENAGQRKPVFCAVLLLLVNMSISTTIVLNAIKVSSFKMKFY